MTARFTIVTPDAQYADDGDIERRTVPQADWHIYHPGGAEPPAAVLAAADALVVWHEIALGGDVVKRLPKCRIIVRAGVGFDHIDLKAAGAAGIPVANTPDYGTSEVADHAIALMLALRRGITTFHDLLKRDPVDNYDSSLAPLVRRNRGTVFGVVGLGRIGIATALRAKAFGMRVIAHDPYAPAGIEIAAGVERVQTLDELLMASDTVSLHCPLTEETRNLMGEAQFARMKPEAILINTARGAIIDIPALLKTLASGRIAGAGIDVLPIEPPASDDPFAVAYRDLAKAGLADRLIVTPHAAWSSPESRADARRLSAETAILYLRDGRLRNLVNGEFLQKPLR